MANLAKRVVLMLVVLLLVTACGQDESVERSQTIAPSLLPPTLTAKPTNTPLLANTAILPTKTSTLIPSETTSPTAIDTSLPTNTPTPLSPLSGSGGGVIAFSSERDGNAEIYVMNADGSDQRNLTQNQARDFHPSWSPDGSQITFYSHRFGYAEIFVMNADGSNLRQLTDNDVNDYYPAWSPDGTQIVFDSKRDGNQEIYIMNADGNNQRRLTNTSADEAFAAWSPDGTKIAFVSERDGNQEIYIMDADGSNQQRLTETIGASELEPDWSPDGAQIAFVSNRSGGRLEVYVMSSDGSDPQKLTVNDSSENHHSPSWSPDGKKIVFAANRDVYVLDVSEALQDPENSDWLRLTHDSATPEHFTTWRSAPIPAVFSFEKSIQRFTAPETFQVGLGDLDGDGDLDAVFANLQRNNSQVWLNDGTGTFVDTGQKLTQYGHGVGLADFDSDGDLDAFIVCHQFLEPSKVYLNDGNGYFQDTGQDFGDAHISAADVNLVDLNGDDHTDIHVLYFDFDGLPDKVYLNDGTGTFMDSGLVLDEDTISWGDLDNDGDVDYFGKYWGIGYVVRFNDGGVQGGTLGQFSTGWQLEDRQSTVGGVALADFDQDGDLDALVTNGFRDTGSRPSRLFWNDGGTQGGVLGQFTDSGEQLNETMGAELFVGDLDNDGDLDVFVTNMDRPNEIWLNNGDGTFIDSGLRLGKNADMSGRPTLGDLDGDGDLDVVVGRFNGGAEIWFNTLMQGNDP